MHLQIFMEDAYYQGVKKAERFKILTDFGLTRVFTKALHKQKFLDEERFEMLAIISKKYEACLPEPVYFFINTPPETCLQRIRLRGRTCEQNIKLNYLENLDFFYREFLKKKKEQGFFIYSFSENFRNEDALEYLEYIEKNIFKV